MARSMAARATDLACWSIATAMACSVPRACSCISRAPLPACDTGYRWFARWHPAYIPEACGEVATLLFGHVSSPPPRPGPGPGAGEDATPERSAVQGLGRQRVQTLGWQTGLSIARLKGTARKSAVILGTGQSGIEMTVLQTGFRRISGETAQRCAGGCLGGEAALASEQVGPLLAVQGAGRRPRRLSAL